MPTRPMAMMTRNHAHNSVIGIADPEQRHRPSSPLSGDPGPRSVITPSLTRAPGPLPPTPERDDAVLAAYGWAPNLDTDGILWNLVALNAERAAEERRNVIRWLRPEFQQPGAAAAQTLSLGLNVVAPVEIDVAPAKWPATLSDRITAVREALSRSDDAMGVEQVARRFKGARRADVQTILESLSALGIAVSLDAGKGRRWMRARAAA